jgi:hypothetical protein
MVVRTLAGLLVTLIFAPLAAVAQGAAPEPGEAWKSSPHHGVTNEATGKPIPCVCRFRGQDFRLGQAVCMQTHLGLVIAKCDLQLNNTTWAPTTESCTVSSIKPIPQQTPG